MYVPPEVVVKEIVINKKHSSFDLRNFYRNSNLAQQDAPHKKNSASFFQCQEEQDDIFKFLVVFNNID
jgi:hypothetical protein